jgi:hypothetical protein
MLGNVNNNPFERQLWPTRLGILKPTGFSLPSKQLFIISSDRKAVLAIEFTAFSNWTI